MIMHWRDHSERYISSYDDNCLSYSVNLMFAGIHLIILDRGVDHAIVSFCVHVYVCVDEQDI